MSREKLQNHEESTATEVHRSKWRDSSTEDQCRPALTSLRVCLLTRQGGQELGAEASASDVRSQGEDWGWVREHSLKGASAPQLAGRESGEKAGTA